MDRAKEAFLREIGKELEERNVAIFAGAGLSVPAGFVSWPELLRPIAEDIGLDVDKEHDLVSLAQYHLNENALNRSHLTKRLLDEFSKSTGITENHRILARLPIDTFWTTNYDKLIETALTDAGRSPDVKYTKKQLAHTKPKRDAVVYKMHGDIDHPDDAVLTKDDYEAYHVKMDQFITALSGDLVSKTFIFIGFSFTDPNLDYILSRVRLAYDRSQRAHYCFLKEVTREEGEDEAEYKYRRRKQELFCGDLKRFNIKTVLVPSYSDITNILRIVEARHKQRSIFISGAAHDFGDWGENTSQRFIHDLSGQLIEAGYKIVSGFGLGVGSAVISGALEKIYMNPRNHSAEQLVLRPFPQQVYGKNDRKAVWTRYRQDMMSYAGVAIFLFGNKIQDGSVVNSSGMLEEYGIAKEQGLALIPVGATGFVSEILWNKCLEDAQEKFGGSHEIVEALCRLGDKGLGPDRIIGEIIGLLEKFHKLGG